MKNRNEINYTVRIAVIIFCLAGLAVITYLVQTNRISAFDDAIYGFFYEHRNPVLTAIMIPITYLGNWQVIMGGSLLLLAVPPIFKSFGIPVAGTAIVVNAVKSLAKVIVKRPRPESVLHLIKQGGYSFPSGHASVSVAFYGMLIYFLRKKLIEDQDNRWNRMPSNIGFSIEKSTSHKINGRIKADILTIAGALLIFLIGISRIYVGVHYPSDVIAGWLLGCAFLNLSIVLCEWFTSK